MSCRSRFFSRMGLRPTLAFSLLTPRVKLHVVGTAKRLNIEHRTSNIERRILMTLRFIYLKTSEPQPATSSAESNFEGQVRFAQFFFKLTEFIIRCWTFDVQCSMFIFQITLHRKLAKTKVSFSIKLAAFQASGWVDTRLHKEQSLSP